MGRSFQDVPPLEQAASKGDAGIRRAAGSLLRTIR